jgi:hypothetical protein
MLLRQRGNRSQRGQVVDSLPNEGFDAVAVFRREVWIAQRAYNLLQPAIQSAYLPAEFRQSR